METSKRALIVISYLGTTSDFSWQSLYAGLESLWPAVIDQTLSRQYGSYTYLKDADATYDRLLAELENVAKSSSIKAVDLFVFLHGGRKSLSFYGSVTSSETLGKAIRDLHIQDKLRMVYSTACYGATHNADFITGGFDVAVGAKGINANATSELPLFAGNWSMGSSVAAAINIADATYPGRVSTWMADEAAKRIYGSEVNSEKQIDGAGTTNIDSGDISPPLPASPWVEATYVLKGQYVSWDSTKPHTGNFIVEFEAWAHYLTPPVTFTWEFDGLGTLQNPPDNNGSFVNVHLPVGAHPPYHHEYSVKVRAVGGNGSTDFTFSVILPKYAYIVPLYDAAGSVKATVQTEKTIRVHGNDIIITDRYYYKQIEVAIICDGVFPPFRSVTWEPTPKSQNGERAVFSMLTGKRSSSYKTVCISVDGVDDIGQDFSIQNSILLPYQDVTTSYQIPKQARKFLPPAWVWDVGSWNNDIVSTKVNGITVELKGSTLRVGKTAIAVESGSMSPPDA